MDLKDFVSTSLTQILEGIRAAQVASKEGVADPRTAGTVAPQVRYFGDKPPARLVNNDLDDVHSVSFDVAVTVQESAGAGGGIKILGIGAEGKLTAGTESVTRLKFSVPVSYPRG